MLCETVVSSPASVMTGHHNCSDNYNELPGFHSTLVGAAKSRERDNVPERFHGFDVDNQFDLGGLDW